jgi:hypothetical protein
MRGMASLNKHVTASPPLGHSHVKALNYPIFYRMHPSNLCLEQSLNPLPCIYHAAKRMSFKELVPSMNEYWPSVTIRQFCTTTSQ